MEVKYLIMQVINWKWLCCGFSCLGEEGWEQNICLYLWSWYPFLCNVLLRAAGAWGSRATAGHRMCAIELPGEGFELAAGKWSLGVGFCEWGGLQPSGLNIAVSLICWLVSHPSITGDSPALVVCSLAFLQGSLPWISALFPRRTGVSRELCWEGGHFNEGLLCGFLSLSFFFSFFF